MLVQGIGDDCAVLRPPRGHDLLVTTDFSLEDVHFRRDWHPPESAGHRCLARGLSDIAAMGGEPLAAFLSLALPRSLPQRWADGFLRGLLRLARSFKVVLAGGDIAQSPAGVLADIMVVGSVPRGRALLRSGAKPGDVLYVTGALGASAAAIHRLRAGRKLRPAQNRPHFFPVPRIAAGQALRQRRLASAAIDLSDGLSTDLSHICEESGVGAVVYAESVPVAKGATLDLALHGGEDYELLFTAPPRTRVPTQIAGVRITRIGEIIRGNRVFIAIGKAGDSHCRRAAGNTSSIDFLIWRLAAWRDRAGRKKRRGPRRKPAAASRAACCAKPPRPIRRFAPGRRFATCMRARRRYSTAMRRSLFLVVIAVSALPLPPRNRRPRRPWTRNKICAHEFGEQFKLDPKFAPLTADLDGDGRKTW